ncbi:voltage-gated hydrogen channel 1 [Pimephales promelas]|uniref:voltage-gated hydrogen channel 1 n=1 Tax=Pimephales promelas TaxID=90988 RepID=UPI0019557FFA|nr:voltage-gated hydrogen channel 1 [Pimephales promelas]XP_039531461.1 voltage-gated hydrogen channel 1 [Pimephales promelas]KAG1970841.1 voltage-gated hydrogen channel [Pimephales promelas]
MSHFLKHFTAVGDEQSTAGQWHDEEPHDASEDIELATGQHLEPVSFRDSLRRLYKTERFQIVVVCLVVLDAIFVLCELLIDLSIIQADHHRIAPQVFHYLSLALLTFFMVELCGKIFAYRLEFLHHKFEVFDGIVVVVSFILDIVYITKEDAFDAMGLLILLRLWRVARIINGILLSVKNRAHHKVQKLKEINGNLVYQVNELQERNTKMDEENARLRALLKQHSIEF